MAISIKSTRNVLGDQWLDRNPASQLARGSSARCDPSESKYLSAAQTEVLAKLPDLAKRAHQPVQEGTFAATDRHERDRRAKFGNQDEAEPAKGAFQKGNKKKVAK